VLSVQSSEENSSDDESSDRSDDESQDTAHYNSEADEENVNGSSWKNKLAEHAARSFLDRETSTLNLQELIYGSSQHAMAVSEDEANDKKGESDDPDEEEFFKVRGEGRKVLPDQGRATFMRLSNLA
jgi:hypothetical protein